MIRMNSFTDGQKEMGQISCENNLVVRRSKVKTSVISYIHPYDLQS